MNYNKKQFVIDIDYISNKYYKSFTNPFKSYIIVYMSDSDILEMVQNLLKECDGEFIEKHKLYLESDEVYSEAYKRLSAYMNDEYPTFKDDSNEIDYLYRVFIQNCKSVHPLTCCGGDETTPNCKRRLSGEARSRGEKVEYNSENEGVLIPLQDGGYICPCGDYKQD